MTESSEEREKRLLRELEGKNISYYTVLLTAWIHTKMERDKTLITLSAAAVGLLITILTTIGAGNWVNLTLIVIAFCGFGVCIFSSLTVYQLNSQHLENELRNKSNDDLKLEKSDKRSIRSFFVGIGFFIAFGVLSTIGFLLHKE